MTEDQAIAWLGDRAVPRETIDALQQYVVLLSAANTRQNLVASSTLSDVWSRHIVDSAQLLSHAGEGPWVDIGSGAGFPGLVIAAIARRPVTLVEPRAKRVEFLMEAITVLGVTHDVTVVSARAEKFRPSTPMSIITARAYAPLPRLLASAQHLATPDTRWILPKGRSAMQELADAHQSWQGDFQILPSVTDPAASIIVATNIRSRSR